MAIGSKIIQGVKSMLGVRQAPARKPDPSVYSTLNLHLSENPDDLLQAHRNVVTHYLEERTERERFFDFMRPGTMWTPEEKAELTRKKKPIIAFDRLTSSQRAFVGAMVMAKYDMTPAPMEPTDQPLSDTLKVLYQNTLHNNSCPAKDVSLIRNAWIGGSSWQESYVEVGPGQKPRIVTVNQNDFAIYPDPDRRDLVTNEDCRFIDRDGFFFPDDLITKFPNKERIIRESLEVPESIDYTATKKTADRQHETFEQRNGRYRVTERFYRVWRRHWYAVNEAGEKEEIGVDLHVDDREEYQKANPSALLHDVPVEYLYLAVACQGIGEYLYNGPYHAQPRNPKTGRIMFSLLELVDEDIAGVPVGHAERMIGPQKAINALAVNMLAEARNRQGTARIGDPDAFDDATKKDITANANDSTRTFWRKTGTQHISEPIKNIPQSTQTSDTAKGMELAESVLEDVSSTPPALKGYSEGNVPAALNEARVQQASVQSQPQVLNYRQFLTQRAILWACYWAEFWTEEEIVRVVEKSNPEDPDFIKINELVIDEWGQPTRRNSLADALRYDITFTESWQSPTMRDQTRRDIAKIMESGAVQGDPVLATFLQYYFLLMTDAPQDLKDFFRQHSQVMQKAQAEEQAQEAQDRDIKRYGALQQLADREASATIPGAPPPEEIPARVPVPGSEVAANV